MLGIGSAHSVARGPLAQLGTNGQQQNESDEGTGDQLAGVDSTPRGDRADSWVRRGPRLPHADPDSCRPDRPPPIRNHAGPVGYRI